MSKKSYGNHSIVSLKGPDQVRKRPGVIFGSDGIEGCQHSVFEILSNAIDEAREGYGNKIIVTKFIDNEIEVQDFARGIPVDFNVNENKYNWELLFCKLYAGGKYNNNEGENYSFALGLNGLGLCATQFASEFMEVEIYNGEYHYIINFKKGFNVTDNKEGFIKKKSSHPTGTRIKWRPDLEVFTEIKIEDDYFHDILKRQAIVNDGLEFVFKKQLENGEFEETSYKYDNGIADYLAEISGDDSLVSNQVWTANRQGKDREDKPEYKVKLKAALTFSNKVKKIEHYHNSSWLEHGGSPDKALRQAFVSQIDSYLKQNNKYLKGESKITFNDIEESLIFISSNFSTQTSYENQTKKAINNKYIYEAMTEWLKHQIEVYFIENPDEAQKITEQILINKRSRENAEKTRLNLKKKLAGNIDISNRVQKFVDCRSKDLSKRELYIVEGDSALGACKLAREAEFQAIIPVRGKILNCLKSDFNKIFNNEIIVNIFKVLGCGVEVNSKANKEISTFNLEALRWNKVVICTDADVDGFQIRTLILTMLYRLAPTLINEGFVYIAESPLYEITHKNKTYFAYSENEKSKIISKFKDGKHQIQRSKGLGENEPEMMSLTTMNPETRRLIKVLPTDIAKTQEMFDMLLGDNLTARKEHIAQNGSQYIDLADIS